MLTSLLTNFANVVTLRRTKNKYRIEDFIFPMTKQVKYGGVEIEDGQASPKEHDLKKEDREEFWKKECELYPEIAECLIYED